MKRSLVTCTIPPLTIVTPYSSCTLQQLHQANVELSEIVLYVRSGAILPLQSATAQHVGQIGGELHVEVFGGQNGYFELVEDDGVSMGYNRDPFRYDART